MTQPSPTDFYFIRHAPIKTPGILAGRTDVEACCDDLQTTVIRKRVSATRFVTSPALRCRQTASTLWPDKTFQVVDGFWEQNFGDWDGQKFDSIPDLGALSLNDLSRHTPPNGESFTDVVKRIRVELSKLSDGTPTVIVAHAGVIRAALAVAMGNAPNALSFSVGNGSVTHLRNLNQYGWAVETVNWTPT